MVDDTRGQINGLGMCQVVDQQRKPVVADAPDKGVRGGDLTQRGTERRYCLEASGQAFALDELGEDPDADIDDNHRCGVDPFALEASR